MLYNRKIIVFFFVLHPGADVDRKPLWTVNIRRERERIKNKIKIVSFCRTDGNSADKSAEPDQRNRIDRSSCGPWPTSVPSVLNLLIFIDIMYSAGATVTVIPNVNKRRHLYNRFFYK